MQNTRSIDEVYKSLCAKDLIDECPEDTCPSMNDLKWEKKIRESFRKCCENHFEVDLPFKEENVFFPNNRKQVLNRLISSRKRLESDPLFFDDYKEFMELMLKNNFVEKVPQEQLVTKSGKSIYLVHFGVLHKQKRKLKVVFDASLKYKGVHWIMDDDVIGFNLNLPQRKNTRRGILSMVFSVYDPFGIACPAILPAKRVFQETCYEGLKWDDPLSPLLQERWNNWLKGINSLVNFKIERCFKPIKETGNMQLHLFCDGSQIAYAAVAYLLYTYTDQKVKRSFVGDGQESPCTT